MDILFPSLPETVLAMSFARFKFSFNQLVRVLSHSVMGLG